MGEAMHDMVHRATVLCADELDDAMRRHYEVQKCWDLEDNLTIVNGVLDGYIKVVSRCLSIPFDPDDTKLQQIQADRLLQLSRIVEQSGRIIRAIGAFEADHYPVESSDEFRGLYRVLDAQLTSFRRWHPQISEDPVELKLSHEEMARFEQGQREFESGNYRPFSEIVSGLH